MGSTYVSTDVGSAIYILLVSILAVNPVASLTGARECVRLIDEYIHRRLRVDSEW